MKLRGRQFGRAAARVYANLRDARKMLDQYEDRLDSLTHDEIYGGTDAYAHHNLWNSLSELASDLGRSLAHAADDAGMSSQRIHSTLKTMAEAERKAMNRAVHDTAESICDAVEYRIKPAVDDVLAAVDALRNDPEDYGAAFSTAAATLAALRYWTLAPVCNANAGECIAFYAGSDYCTASPFGILELLTNRASSGLIALREYDRKAASHAETLLNMAEALGKDADPYSETYRAVAGAMAQSARAIGREGDWLTWTSTLTSIMTRLAQQVRAVGDGKLKAASKSFADSITAFPDDDLAWAAMQAPDGPEKAALMMEIMKQQWHAARTMDEYRTPPDADGDGEGAD